MNGDDFHLNQATVFKDEYDISYGNRVIANVYKDHQNPKWSLVLDYKGKKYLFQSSTRNIFSALLGKSESQLVDQFSNKIIFKTGSYKLTGFKKVLLTDGINNYELVSTDFFNRRHVLKRGADNWCTYSFSLSGSHNRINIPIRIESKEFSVDDSDKLFLLMCFGLFIHLVQVTQSVVSGLT